MHTVQYLMGVHYPMCDDWFIEAIAEEISGGFVAPITNLSQLEAWLANPMFSVHPIDIHSTDDYPEPYLETSGRYYPMFHLIMSYLLSEHGLGKTYMDVKNMFAEITVTNDFSQAFSNHFGITTKVLKDVTNAACVEYHQMCNASLYSIDAKTFLLAYNHGNINLNIIQSQMKLIRKKGKTLE